MEAFDAIRETFNDKTMSTIRVVERDKNSKMDRKTSKINNVLNVRQRTETTNMRTTSDRQLSIRLILHGLNLPKSIVHSIVNVDSQMKSCAWSWCRIFCQANKRNTVWRFVVNCLHVWISIRIFWTERLPPTNIEFSSMIRKQNGKVLSGAQGRLFGQKRPACANQKWCRCSLYSLTPKVWSTTNWCLIGKKQTVNLTQKCSNIKRFGPIDI